MQIGPADAVRDLAAFTAGGDCLKAVRHCRNVSKDESYLGSEILPKLTFENIFFLLFVSRASGASRSAGCRATAAEPCCIAGCLTCVRSNRTGRTRQTHWPWFTLEFYRRRCCKRTPEPTSSRRYSKQGCLRYETRGQRFCHPAVPQKPGCRAFRAEFQSACLDPTMP